MRIGISAYGLTPTDAIALARDAEAAGFDSLWIGEHILAPRAYSTTHPQSSRGFQQFATPHADASVHLLDPLTTLTAAGAVTDRISLATGIYVAPLRHPLHTARSVCTAQEICGGRLILGMGAGWLTEEFAALDVPYSARFRRLEAGVDIIRDALAGGWISRTDGEYVFDDVQITGSAIPVPLILGGNTGTALRRSVRLGDGWFSSGTPTLGEAIRLRTLIDIELEAQGRVDPFRTWFRMPGAEVDELHRWAEAGFDDIVIWASTVWPTGDPDRGAILAEHAARLRIS